MTEALEWLAECECERPHGKPCSRTDKAPIRWCWPCKAQWCIDEDRGHTNGLRIAATEIARLRRRIATLEDVGRKLSQCVKVGYTNENAPSLPNQWAVCYESALWMDAALQNEEYNEAAAAAPPWKRPKTRRW